MSYEELSTPGGGRLGTPASREIFRVNETDPETAQGATDSDWLLRPGAISYRGVIFPWDCDAMGHLNNKHYFGLFDQAAWHLFLALGFRPVAAARTGLGLADVNQSISLKREVLAGQLIVIRSYLERVGTKSLTARHEMFDAENGEPVAQLLSVTAFFDLQLRRATPIPTQIRAAAQGWLDVQQQAAALQAAGS
jgi:acyl-CoA thioester hydrolase